MVSLKQNKINRIKDWFYCNQGLTKSVLTILFFSFGYYFLTKKNKDIDFNSYTNKVQVIHLDYEKIYSLPKVYSTEEKLDKIIFDLQYFHNNIKFDSKIVMHWKYITPNLERIIDNREFGKLTVKCKQEFPQEAMIFIKEK